MKANLYFFISLWLLCSSCKKEEPSVEPNNPPEISELTTSRDIVEKNGTVSLSASTIDYEKDAVSYSWSCPQGNFSQNGKGANVRWTAPVISGNYTITLIVSDGKDTDTATTSIEVVHLHKDFSIDKTLSAFWFRPHTDLTFVNNQLTVESNDTYELGIISYNTYLLDYPFSLITTISNNAFQDNQDYYRIGIGIFSLNLPKKIDYVSISVSPIYNEYFVEALVFDTGANPEKQIIYLDRVTNVVMQEDNEIGIGLNKNGDIQHSFNGKSGTVSLDSLITEGYETNRRLAQFFYSVSPIRNKISIKNFTIRDE